MMQEKIVANCKQQIWDIDEEDLVDEISDTYGFCVLDLDYETMVETISVVSRHYASLYPPLKNEVKSPRRLPPVPLKKAARIH